MGKAAIAVVNGVLGTASSASTGSQSVTKTRTDTASTAAAAANSGDKLVPSQGCRLTVSLTALSGTSPTIAFALWDSADGVTFAAVPGAVIPAMNAVGTAMLAVTVPVRRFAALASTVTGTTPSATFTWILDDGIIGFTPAQNPDHTPVKDTRT